MPDTGGRSKRYRAWRLSDAHRNGQIVTITCHWCKISRHYLPDELRQVTGDVEVDHCALRMRCERCHRREYLDVKGWVPSAADRMRITFRRLAEVRMVRKIVWRDQLPGER